MPEKIRHTRLGYAAAIELDANGKLPYEVQMLPVGIFGTTKYGEVSLTDENFFQVIANLSRGIPKSGIPTNIQHRFEEVAGWVKKLIHRPVEGMFAVLDWTTLGSQKLTEPHYRFFSTDVVGVFSHVAAARRLIGAVLT